MDRVLGHENTAKVGMIAKHDAEHVIHFSFEPISRLPHRNERVYPRFLLREKRFQPNPVAVLE
jgi:hypothetical protein